MLKLTISKDEYLMVGKEVKITVTKVNERSVDLAIDAPREVNVARGKAIRKRAAEKEAAEKKTATIEAAKIEILIKENCLI